MPTFAARCPPARWPRCTRRSTRSRPSAPCVRRRDSARVAAEMPTSDRLAGGLHQQGGIVFLLLALLLLAPVLWVFQMFEERAEAPIERGLWHAPSPPGSR